MIQVKSVSSAIAFAKLESGSVRLNKLAPGVEIWDIDISAGLAQEELDKVKEVFFEHGLIFIMDQNISEPDHIAFAEHFGEININRFFQAHPEYSQVALVTKEPDQVNNIGGDWHTDHSYDELPALGSVLAARQLPPTGGDTWFVSMYDALEELSVGLRDSLKQMRAVHSAHHVFGTQASAAAEPGARISNPESADALSEPVHPVIIKHPLSGKEALYINPGFTLRFEGWTEEESRPLLEFLYSQATKSENITRFKWRPGSIAFWDNRATWHNAQNDYDGFRREMHRITIEGCELEPADVRCP